MESAILTIKDFTFSYGDVGSTNDWRLLIQDIQIYEKTIYVVTGTNMSGKSTFLNLIAGLQPYHKKSGQIISAQGEPYESIKLSSLSIFLSSSDSMFPDLSTWDNIRIALPRMSKRQETEYYQRTQNFLRAVDIFMGHSLDDRLSTLSTGGRALVKLARAHLVRRPIVLIDELTSYLDDSRARFFLDLVIGLTDHRAAVLIVSHNERDRIYLKERARELDIDTHEFKILRENETSKIF